MTTQSTPPGAVTPAVSIDQAIAAVEELLAQRRGSFPVPTADTSFQALGLDSLDMAELFVIVERTVGRRLDSETAGEVLVVSDLARLQPA
jgi:acyl carrier protein